MGTSINGTHHIQYMAGIGGKRLPVFLDFVSQFKEQFLALIFPFEKWLEYNISPYSWRRSISALPR